MHFEGAVYIDPRNVGYDSSKFKQDQLKLFQGQLHARRVPAGQNFWSNELDYVVELLEIRSHRLLLWQFL